MTKFALPIVAFGIVFLSIGAISTYIRLGSAVDDPLVAEIVGWLSGTLLLVWTGVIKLLEYTLPEGVLYSAIGVFLFGVVLNGVSLYVSIKVWEYYNPAWLTENAPYNAASAETPTTE